MVMLAIVTGGDGDDGGDGQALPEESQAASFCHIPWPVAAAVLSNILPGGMNAW